MSAGASPAGRRAAPSSAGSAPPPYLIEPLEGRCRVCGLGYGGILGREAGVIRLDRARWRALCPGAAWLTVPAACAGLRASFGGRTRS
ncbi:hypothetical protein LOK46_01065 [Methylobacterium sp. NMS14P]|uniref:hypothetical protein n=1 Tax=Methylobacterium sp. NMS14P TaxID=2894310 RepID=UPI0023597BF7|nr:hypothetical protein [Methylobacterium sp. NMS14P]WCS25461.1 hypothetical protein LOK46_01065 [Methylobacterium sp. NMS14P]